MSPADVEQVESVAPASGERVQCAECQTMHNAGRVVVDPVWCAMVAEKSIEMASNLRRAKSEAARLGVHYVMRSLFCSHGEIVQTWGEATTSTGKPTGLVLTDPVIIREPAALIELFRNRNPEAAGVLQR